MQEPKTLADLKQEHGFHPGGHLVAPKGEAGEQSPLRNYVRDLVLGFNDGLVSVYAVTAGVAGATFTPPQILVAGVAAAIAGALSMGTGEYISTKSQSQFYEAERKREEEHLDQWPHLEIQELREDLQAKGFESPLLEQMVEAISSDRKRFLDYMMREEFGVGKESERSPPRAATFIMVAFLAGSILAVAPYAVLPEAFALGGSTLLSLAALFVAGVVRAKTSRLPAFRAGAEMVMVGAVAGIITFGVGTLLGIAI